MQQGISVGLFELGDQGIAIPAGCISEVVAATDLGADDHCASTGVSWRGIDVPLVTLENVSPTVLARSTPVIAIVQHENKAVALRFSRAISVAKIDPEALRSSSTVSHAEQSFELFDVSDLFRSGSAVVPPRDSIRKMTDQAAFFRHFILASLEGFPVAIDAMAVAAILPSAAVSPSPLPLRGWKGIASYLGNTVYVSSTLAFWFDVEGACPTDMAADPTAPSSPQGAVIIMRDGERLLALEVDRVTAAWSGTEAELGSGDPTSPDRPTINLPRQGGEHLYLDSTIISRSTRLRGMAALGRLHEPGSESQPAVNLARSVPGGKDDGALRHYLVFRYGGFVGAIDVANVHALIEPTPGFLTDEAHPRVEFRGESIKVDVRNMSKQEAASSDAVIVMRSGDHRPRALLATKVCQIVHAKPWHLPGWDDIQDHRYISAKLNGGSVAALIMSAD